MNIKRRAVRHVGGFISTDRPTLKKDYRVIGERVWCVQVTTGAMLTRRNGKVAVVGNCGRTTRPLMEIRTALQDAPDAAARRAIIEASAKPWAAMVDLVGVHPDAKDMGVIDIIGDYLPDELRRRTMKMMLEKAAAAEAKDDEDAQDGDPAEMDVGAVARDAQKVMGEERRAAEEEIKRKRARIEVGTRNVHVEWDKENNQSHGVMGRKEWPKDRGGLTDRQMGYLIACGVNPDRVWSMNRRQGNAIIGQYHKQGKKPDWSIVRQWERSSGNKLDMRPKEKDAA